MALKIFFHNMGSFKCSRKCPHDESNCWTVLCSSVRWLFLWCFKSKIDTEYNCEKQKQREAETVQDSAHILFWLQEGASTVLSCNFGLTPPQPFRPLLDRNGNGSGIVGNDRCGSGEPLKGSYVITGSHTAFDGGAEGPGGGEGGLAFPHYLARRRPGNAARCDLTDSTHLSVWS